ncbi:hypothetical protein D3C80_1695920 [compost metagenome]
MPFFASKEPHVYGLSFQSVGLAENADQRADSQRTFGRSVSTGSGAGAKPRYGAVVADAAGRAVWHCRKYRFPAPGDLYLGHVHQGIARHSQRERL